MASYKVSYKSNNHHKLSMKKSKYNGVMPSSKKSYAEVVNNNHKDESQNNVNPKAHNSLKCPADNLPQLECVTRLTAIPIVGVSLDVGGKLYTAVKDSNAITNWTLSKAESSLMTYLHIMGPAVRLFNGPITSLDKLVCKSLDIVEQRVPQLLHLPPDLIYVNAQDYMTKHIVKPVLKRADSVKQMGNAVLDSKITAFAADTVDGVLDKAEIYVDKYLPIDEQDDTDQNSKSDEIDSIEEPRQHVVRTVKHADRLSRKLRRRLSRRTTLEMSALKVQTTEAINVLVYAAELIVKDPQLAYEKAKALWAELSKDEPGNQARPETLEQFIALLTRETARKIVHLTNYVKNGIIKLPKNIIRRLKTASFDFLLISNLIIQHFDITAMKNHILHKVYNAKIKMDILLQVMYQKSQFILEQLALFIAGGSQVNKRSSVRCRFMNNHFLHDVTATINGVNQ